MDPIPVIHRILFKKDKSEALRILSEGFFDLLPLFGTLQNNCCGWIRLTRKNDIGHSQTID
jgi:hypothetical protein